MMCFDNAHSCVKGQNFLQEHSTSFFKIEVNTANRGRKRCYQPTKSRNPDNYNRDIHRFVNLKYQRLEVKISISLKSMRSWGFAALTTRHL
jgi:hypothetical protein